MKFSLLLSGVFDREKKKNYKLKYHCVASSDFSKCSLKTLETVIKNKIKPSKPFTFKF